MPVNMQLGVKAEDPYGTEVVVDTFFEETPGSPIAAEVARVEGGGVRSGRRVQSSTNFSPHIIGYSGSKQFEVKSTDFEFWLEQCLGGISASTDDPVSGVDTYTGTVGDLCGTGFTLQENLPLTACGNTDQSMTYWGGKVASWELSCEVEGNVMLSVELVFQDGDTTTTLATASYTANEVLSWAGATLDIDSTQFPVNNWSISCDNMLKTDRRSINGTTARREPVEAGLRDITVSFEVEWGDESTPGDLTLYNAMKAATAAGTLVELDINTVGLAVITGSTYPALNINLPAVRIDEANPQASGYDPLTQTVTGKALDNGTDEPITVVYVTDGS